MKKYFPTLLKVLAAAIMVQTLYFKFLGAEESIDLFTKLAGENESIMRIGTGVLELLAAIFLFVPSKTWFGAFLTVILMSGAIMSHLTILGIEHNNDGGILFISAITTFLAGTILLIQNKKDIPYLALKQ